MDFTLTLENKVFKPSALSLPIASLSVAIHEAGTHRDTQTHSLADSPLA